LFESANRELIIERLIWQFELFDGGSSGRLTLHVTGWQFGFIRGDGGTRFTLYVVEFEYRID
jgi:hypothetical protein